MATLWFVTVLCYNVAQLRNSRYTNVSIFSCFIITGVAPLLYLPLAILHWMCPHRLERLGLFRRAPSQTRERRQRYDSEELLPDRLVNPHLYDRDNLELSASDSDEELTEEHVPIGNGDTY